MTLPTPPWDYKTFLLQMALPAFKLLSFCFKGGKLVLIHVCADDADSNDTTGIATYNLLYKVWENMAEDNIITEVK